MANRAYLYAVDSLGPDAWDHRERDYYDSRWNIPLAWFFFFTPQDLLWVDVEFDGATWKELKLAADKEAALTKYSEREPLLLSLVGPPEAAPYLAGFRQQVTAWAGRHLVMDPEEVLAGGGEEPEERAERWSRLFAALDSDNPDRGWILAELESCSGKLNPDPKAREGEVIGFTYA